jgi:hypothetical protein
MPLTGLQDYQDSQDIYVHRANPEILSKNYLTLQAASPATAAQLTHDLVPRS